MFFGGLGAAVIAGVCILCSIVSLLPIASAATGSTEMTMQADDSQISWTVPIAVTFAVNGDGTFQVPTNGQFTNTSVFDIHVSNIAVSAPSGVNLAKTSTITSATAADTIGFTVTPGSGTAIEVADYTTAAAPAIVADWVIEAGSTLATSYAGKMSSYGSLDPANTAKVATITWTAAAGNGTEYNGPSLTDPTVATTLTVAQVKAAKNDPNQTENLENYEKSGNLKVSVEMADSTTKTATLVDHNDSGLAFMIDENVATMPMNSSGATAHNRFDETEIYAALQSGGSVYNLFSSTFLAAIIPQDVKVATVYDETDGALTTLPGQVLWLPSNYDIRGREYIQGDTAASSLESTFTGCFDILEWYEKLQGGYWLRSAYSGNNNAWLHVSGDDVYSSAITYSNGVRPCFTL